MKRIKLSPINQFRGEKFQLPVRDARGRVQTTLEEKLNSKGEIAAIREIPVIKDTDSFLEIIGDFLNYGFPQDYKWTFKDAEMIRAIKNRLDKASEQPELEIADDELTWLRDIIKEDKVGVSFFRATVGIVYDYLHQNIVKE